MEFRIAPLCLALAVSIGTGCSTANTRTAINCQEEDLSVIGENICPKGPSDDTKEKNTTVYNELPFSGSEPSEVAVQPYEKNIPDAPVGEDTVWNRSDFSFLDNIEPDGVNNLMINPSLLRQAKLNNNGGLFEVDTNGKGEVYQVRGLDLSVMTFIRSDHGWIVIDPLTAKETAEKGIELLKQQTGSTPVVSAVVFTHSHIDHFGGVFGVIEEGNPKNIPIYAPVDFFEHSVSENVIAGNIMSRRAAYMYGNIVDASDEGKGKVDGGLGKTTPTGLSGIIEPTEEISIDRPGNIDGQPVHFVMANGSEAPSEFMIYFDDLDMLMAAEVATKTIHNISSLRGAKTRDSKAWTTYLDRVLQKFGDEVQLMIASHHWPTLTNAKVVEQLEKTRDSYKYVHDQTLRLANMGYTPNEISEEVKLPDALGKEWFNRGYYGTVSHNARATYDFYLGAWWDGNPANLDPLSPTKEGDMYVSAFTADGLISAARDLMAPGTDNYRGAVRLLNHVIFSDGAGTTTSQKETARLLSANAMEQLGYQAESGPWRNYYLGAAKELREGAPPTVAAVDTTGISSNLDTFSALDSLAIRVNPERADGMNMIINYTVSNGPGVVESFSHVLNNSVLKTYSGSDGVIREPGVTPKKIEIHAFYPGAILKLVSDISVNGECDESIAGLSITQGDVSDLQEFCSTFDIFDTEFGIAMP